MPINPNIILGLKPMEVTDPLETQARFQAIKGARQQQEMHALQLEQAKMAQAEAWDAKQRDQALQEKFAQNPNLGADEIIGTVGPQRGLPILKQMHEQRTALLTEQEKKHDLAAKQTARFASLAGSVTNDETYVSAIRQAVDEGLLPREKAVPLMMRKYGPEVQKYLDGVRTSALTAQQKFEEDRKAVQDQRAALEFQWKQPAQPFMQQKAEAEATAAQQEVAGTKPIQPTDQMRADQAKAALEQQAREAAANRALTIRGQNMTDSRGRELAAIARDTATANRDNKPPSEAERKNAGFYSRALSATQDIDTLEAAMAKKGLFGQAWMSAAPNFLQSEENQKFTQAQRAFTEARLRRDSGAAIPEQEFANDRKMYFPQPGDTAAVLEQKRVSREKALSGMLVGAGRAMKELHGAEQTVEAGSAARRGVTPQPRPVAGTVVDGYEFLGGDPADKNRWKKQ